MSNATKILSDHDVEKMIRELFSFLKETGVKFDKHEQAYDLLTKAGCDISSEGMVKFPAKLVEDCLSHVPKSFKWWNRAGTEYVEYGSGNVCFIADAKAPNYIDPITKEKKPTDPEASALMVRLADAMLEMDICGTPVTSDNFIAVSNLISGGKNVLKKSFDKL